MPEVIDHSVRIQCHMCQAVIGVPAERRGTTIECDSCAAVIDVPKARFAPQMVFADYLIKRRLGHGSVGAVFLAEQRSLERNVALKILHKKFNEHAELNEGLIKEARVAAKLNHPHIAQCYAVGRADGVYFFAMEYVPGQTLLDIVEEIGPMPIDEALRIIRQVAEALDYAWREVRLVHRDIKPANILMKDGRIPKLADLGLARPLAEVRSEQNDFIKGTPHYISPEEVLGKEVDMRSDLYSLGCVLYRSVTGVPPFHAQTAEALLELHVKHQARPPTEVLPEVPADVSALIMRMIAKDPDERPPDMAALIVELDRLLAVYGPAAYEQKATLPSRSRPTGTASVILKPGQRQAPPRADETTNEPRKPPTRAPVTDTATKLSEQKRWVPVAATFAGIVLVALLLLALTGRDRRETGNNRPSPANPIATDDQPTNRSASSSTAGAAPKPEPAATGPAIRPPASESPAVTIVAAMPNPAGDDYGNETIVLRNNTDTAIDLDGWALTDAQGDQLRLEQLIQPISELSIRLPRSTIRLNNGGDTLRLLNYVGDMVSEASYSATDVTEGILTRFPESR